MGRPDVVWCRQQYKKERDNVTTAIGTFIGNTIRGWGDSPDPQVGWCNVNNPAVIERWINAWK